MKNILILFLFSVLPIFSFADELEGPYTTPSRVSNQLELKIFKSNGKYFIRAKKKNEQGYTTYSTNESSYEEGSNYLFGEMSMQGIASSLGKKCRIHYYCTNGSIKEINATIDGVEYNLMKIPDLRNLSKRNQSNQTSNTSTSNRQNTYDTQTWVNLGLPSGTLWKTHNESGFFTEKEAYNLFGTKLPTKKQIEELVAVCDWEWYGNGYKVTGPNGKFIKLPASGWRNLDGNVGDVGYCGLYWSRSYDNNERYWLLECFTNNKAINSKYWKFGYTVRLVQNQ